MAGGQAGWDQLAEGMALRDAVSGNDAVSAVEQAAGQQGQQLGIAVGGVGNAGSSGQGPIKVVGDVTRRELTCSQRPQRHGHLVDPRTSCGNRLTCQTWTSPAAAAAFATRVLGEREQPHLRGAARRRRPRPAWD